MPSRWWRLAVIVATATAKVSEKARQHARNDQEEYANWRRLFRCEEGVVYEGFQPLTHALPGRLNLPRERDRLLRDAAAVPRVQLPAVERHGRRPVAFAPAPAGPFGAFTPVSILGWGPCDVPFASVYYAAVNANPTDGATLLGLFPVNRGGRCVLGLAATCDGVHFGALEELLDLGCEIQGRTADYPVDGFLVDGDAHAVFVHRDMPTEDIVKAGAERLAPRLTFSSADRDDG
ncbi:ligase [Aureococcus anophagefferens]|nr:ligase [Aureococcus anophagefferens]